jgi:MFS family permease
MQRRVVVCGIVLGMALSSLEATIVGPAMPRVVASLHDLSGYAWVFSAYLLTWTGSLPLWGQLSDAYGRRRVYVGGVTLFIAGSLLAGFATRVDVLVLGRALQGVGAGATATSVTILGELFGAHERARAQALYSGVWGVAAIAGPPLGGYLTDALSWRWVFLLNLPFGLLAILLLMVSYPAVRPDATARIDWRGALLLFALTAMLSLALSAAGPLRVAGLGLAFVLAVGCVAAQRAGSTVIPSEVLRTPIVRAGLIVSLMLGVCLFGAIAYLPLLVQTVLGASASAAGRAMVPFFASWVPASLAAAPLANRAGHRAAALIGGAMMTLGFGGLIAGAASVRLGVIVCAALLGAGVGIQLVTVTVAVQQSVRRRRLGVATALPQFVRGLGGGTGVALMGIVFAAALNVPGAAVPLGHGTVDVGAAAPAAVDVGLWRVFLIGTLAAATSTVASWWLEPRSSLTEQESHVDRE